MATTTTLGHLAELVDGQLEGEAEIRIRGAATLDTATEEEISFADDPRLSQAVGHSRAAALVVHHDFPSLTRPTVRVGNVRRAFVRIVMHFRPPRTALRIGISPRADISPLARIAPDVDIYPGVYIGPDVSIARGSTIHANVTILAGCRIEEGVTIFPGAVLYEDTRIGPRCVIHAGAVLGAYGFGYDTLEGRHVRREQLGYVQLGADVEVGAGSTIDRGSFGATEIGDGTKIDNQVMIAHNCRIGRHNLICSQVGIAGSSTTGDYVVMAGQVGVPDHVRIGHRAVLGAKAGILRDVPDGAAVIGIPATDEREQMACQAAFARLPEMRRQLRRLQREVDRLNNLVQTPSGEKDSSASTDAA